MQKTIHHLRDCSEEYVSLCDMDLTVDDICLPVHSQRIAGMSKVLAGCIIEAQHNRNTLPTRLCIPMYDDKLDKQAVQELLRLIHSDKRIDSMQQMIKMTKQQELLVRITVLAGKYDMLDFLHQLDFALAACCNDARAPAIPDSIHIALAEVTANGTVHLPNYMRFLVQVPKPRESQFFGRQCCKPTNWHCNRHRCHAGACGQHDSLQIWSLSMKLLAMQEQC